MSREASPRDTGSSPTGRSTSPVAKARNTATIVAFRNARDTSRRSLSEKNMKRIMIPTGPEDVVNEIDKWHKRHSDSKVAASVRFGLGQLQRFNASIYMLAQGTPSPGCLLWGSIKFVLTVSCMLILCPCRSASTFVEDHYLRTHNQHSKHPSSIPRLYHS